MSCKYINRDLSWLDFNRRVLEEAQQESTPLLERAKFLAIVTSNLDEYMSVRVAGIRRQIKMGITEKDFTGYTPHGLMRRIVRRTRQLTAAQYDTFRQIVRKLALKGIHFTRYERLPDRLKRDMDSFFFRTIFPSLKPMAIGENEPFPLIPSKGLYFCIVLQPDTGQAREDECLVLMEMPAKIMRYIGIPGQSTQSHRYILLEDLIKAHTPALFPQRKVIGVSLFRIIRDSELSLDEDSAEDLLQEVELKLKRRIGGAPVHLEAEKGIHPIALQRLEQQFDVADNVALIDGPVDIGFLMKFSQSLPDYDHLRYPRYEPIYPREFEDDDFFSVLRKRDVAVYFPYESFAAFDDFLEQAAADPSISTIKMTLYRVSKQSRIVRALSQAARNGKLVTVVVELKARFDEARNIAWAKTLEKAGCHVIHGWIGLKIHAKMTMIERREPDGIKRYVHVSTGNYNGQTAQNYTDIGLFTSHPAIADDIADLFEEIAGYHTHNKSQFLAVSPTDLRAALEYLIEREMHNAAAGMPARIIAKMNSLSDPHMVDTLYEASQAGVQIDLIVRGICCLCPGVPGQSDNISVRSIVDRYLEHSRIFYFENGGMPEVWLSSADWMTRNLSRRIELMCPVLNAGIRDTIIQLMKLLLTDNVKARRLLPGGKYATIRTKLPAVRSQFLALPIIIRKYDRPASTMNDWNSHSDSVGIEHSMPTEPS